MQTAIIYGYKSKKSGIKIKYVFSVRFADGESVTRRKFMYYGICRNQCMEYLIEQLRREFPGTAITIDRSGLCSEIWYTSATRVERDGATYVRIHYEFNEFHDTFECEYRCEHGVDPIAWKEKYLSMNTAAGEYHRYLGENPRHGFGNVMDLVK